MSESEQKRETGSYWLWAVLALTAVAAGLRLYRLNQGFWYDELFSLEHFFRAPWLTLLTRMPDPNHHPLYSLMAKLSITVLGESEWTARLPAAIAGTATVPLAYLVGAKLLDRASGYIAATLLTFNMWHVYLSQDARGYSAMIFFSLGATYFFLLSLEKATMPRVAACALLGAASMYTHLYSVAVPAGLLATAVLMAAVNRDRGARERLLPLVGPAAALALAGLAYLPMAGDMIHFARTEGQIIGTREFGGQFVETLVYSWASGTESPWLSLPCMACALAGVVFAVQNKRELLAAWILIFIAALGIPLVTDTFVYHRFYSFLMPGFFLLAGFGVSRLVSMAQLPVWAAVAAGFVLATPNLPALHDYQKLGKQGLEGAAEWIAKNAPGKKVFILGLATKEFQYYCPYAIPVEKEVPLKRVGISDSVVVYAFPWSVTYGNRETLERDCGPAVVFEAAGYPENEVRLYKCP